MLSQIFVAILSELSAKIRVPSNLMILFSFPTKRLGCYIHKVYLIWEVKSLLSQTQKMTESTLTTNDDNLPKVSTLLPKWVYNQWLILVAFLFSVALVGVLALSVQRLTESTINDAAKIVDLQYEKLHNLLNLHLFGEKRTVNLSLILLQDDAFEQDKALMNFYKNGKDYTTYRDNLTRLIKNNARESEWLQQISDMAKITGPLQNHIAALAMNDQKEQGIALLTQEVIPQFNAFSQKVNEFSLYQSLDTKRLISEAKQQVDQMMRTIIMIALLIIAISSTIAFVIGRKFLRMNRSLVLANETLEKKVNARTQSLYETKEALLEKNRILEELSITDPLTQLYNRLKMESLLEAYQQDFEQNGTAFSLLLIDLDFFKSINDTFGHNQGDQVLIELSACLKLFFTEKAHLGRWGGEEFIVLLEDSDVSTAEQTSEAFRKLIEDHEFSISKPLTVSIGVAAIEPNEPIAEFIHRADMALYSAKHQGRNRVRASQQRRLL